MRSVQHILLAAATVTAGEMRAWGVGCRGVSVMLATACSSLEGITVRRSLKQLLGR